MSVHLEEAVSESLTQLEDGWRILADVRIDGSSDVTGADYALMHAQLGVALIDLMLARTDDPPRRLRKLMDDEGFSSRFAGTLPIVRLVLQSTDTWLGDQLEVAFAEAPPLTIADPHWVDALHELLAPPLPASDPSPVSFFERSSANVPALSAPKWRCEETRTWLDELWQVIPERRPPGVKPLERRSQSMPPDRNARLASIPDKQSATIEGQQWWSRDQHREPAAWEAAPEVAAVDSERRTLGLESWRARVAVSLVLVAILSSGAVWLLSRAAPSEEATRPIEATATATSPSIAAVVPAPSTVSETNPAESRNAISDRREPPAAAAAHATVPASALAAKPQTKPTRTPPSQAAHTKVSNPPEPVQRPAASVRRSDEKGVRRLIFEWPGEVEFTAKVVKGEAKIQFKSAARIDPEQLSAAASGLNPRVSRSDGSVLVFLTLPAGSRMMAHRRGNRVALDIAVPSSAKPRSRS